jgi:pectinesterase
MEIPAPGMYGKIILYDCFGFNPNQYQKVIFKMKKQLTWLIFILLLSCQAFAQKKAGKIIVALDGTGTYSTVQAAFNAIPSSNTNPVTIFIKKGIYKEPLVLDSGKNFVSLIGEDAGNTILTYDNHTGKKSPGGDIINTRTSASFFIYADDFAAQNISFQNNAGFDSGQAVAVFAKGNRLAFKNCRFLGFQDVLFCSGNGAKQYYQDCYIEGTTDFIFGPATAIFKSCSIHSKKNSHVTAASTNTMVTYGFVFMDCTLTADSNINKVSLGRPWKPAASVTYIRCNLGKHILPEGWNNWKDPANELTARYAEYKSTGDGANPGARVSWSRQLSDDEAKEFTLKNIFGNWEPLHSL